MTIPRRTPIPDPPLSVVNGVSPILISRSPFPLLSFALPSRIPLIYRLALSYILIQVLCTLPNLSFNGSPNLNYALSHPTLTYPVIYAVLY